MKKICKKCGRNRKIGKFGKLSCKPDGKNIYCRDCMKEIRDSYKKTSKGSIIQKKSEEKYRNRNKEKRKDYNKEYYKKNKQRIIYNKKSKKDTECILIFENSKKPNKKKINKIEKLDIQINPKRRKNG